MAFFFSAICNEEKKKGSNRKVKMKVVAVTKNFESSQVPSFNSQQWLDGNLASVNKALCPAVAY